MKRTKQRFDKDDQSPPVYVSGCRQFEGEDRCKSIFYVNVQSLMVIMCSFCRQDVRER